MGTFFCAGSGAETPTSEPGLCATDMWDSDWDEDPEEFYVYRHQVQCKAMLLSLHGCEVMSVALREECKLRQFHHRVVRRIFGPKGKR